MDPVLFSLYQDDWERKCLGVASYCCLVYDHALTFDKEFEFVWKAPWTFTKAVFLLNRYGNLVCQTAIQLVKLIGVPNHPAEYCDVPNGFSAIYMISSQESIHILVLLRAWAIWGCERRVAVMLVGSYVIYLLFFVIKATFNLMSLTIHTFKYADMPEICITVVAPNSWIICVAKGCQDTVVFAITMVSLWRHSRTSQYLYPTGLLFLLVRDAVIFYAASIFFDVFNGVTWPRVIYSSNPKGILCLTFAVNLLSISGQRLVLNLRGFTIRTYGSRSLSAEVDRQLQIFSDIQRAGWRGPSASQPDGIPRVENPRKVHGDIEMDALDVDPTGLPSRAADVAPIGGASRWRGERGMFPTSCSNG